MCVYLAITRLHRKKAFRESFKDTIISIFLFRSYKLLKTSHGSSNAESNPGSLTLVPPICDGMITIGMKGSYLHVQRVRQLW